MNRNPTSIALAAIAAILIVLGRVNRDSDWGIWMLLAGFAVLIVAGLYALRAKR